MDKVTREREVTNEHGTGISYRLDGMVMVMVTKSLLKTLHVYFEFAPLVLGTLPFVSHVTSYCTVQ